MMRSTALIALGLTVGAGVASAQDQDENLDELPGMESEGSGSAEASMSTASSSTSAGGLRLVLPKGQIYAEAFLEFNLSKDAFFKPVAVQPDVWYGVNDELTVGLAHSPRALSGFQVGAFPGGGLCLGSKSADVGSIPACGSTYSTVGLVARYHLLDSPVVVAGDGGLIVNDFDPFAMSLKLGAVGEWVHSDAIAVLFGLNVSIGLAGRDDGNKEFLNLPIAVMYRVMAGLNVGVQTGFRTPFADAADFYSIPLSIGARYVFSPKITFDGSFTLPILVTGVPNASGVAARVLTLGGSYVF